MRKKTFPDLSNVTKANINSKISQIQSVVAREQIEQGKRYLTEANELGTEGMYSLAFACFKNAAARGDDEAFYYLGVMYLNGLSVDKDTEKAVNYLTLFLKDLAEARYMLGKMFQSGSDVEKNDAEANKQFAKAAQLFAAETEDAEAQYKLGMMYKNGSGVEQNLTKAVEFFTLAASNGHVKAQHNLEDPGLKMKSHTTQKGAQLQRRSKNQSVGEGNPTNPAEQGFFRTSPPPFDTEIIVTSPEKSSGHGLPK